MQTLDAQDAEAKKRVTDFVNRSLVLITDAPSGVESSHPGTGTLLRLASGLIGVLTAKHVLPTALPMGVVTDDCHYDDAIDGIVSEHPSCDIAFALLRPALGRKLADLAIPIEQVEDTKSQCIEPGVPLVTAGFPKQFARKVTVADGRVEHRFVAFFKYTTQHNHDKRHVSIEWREGYPIDRGQPAAHPALDVAPGEPVFLKKPVWMSGGPVYRIDPAPFNSFDAAKQCRLIAVTTDYTDGQRELAVPWWRWIDWLKTG